ncbi:hypothetical protein [Arthrobacter sp. W4I7]|uniref:hypothetical protein n=1 Tax=Arthrobacter sp. W4I7 TaxID=3042296 RepID=UPI00277F41F9|nr:hypothetical protein [Arthrobacter sp. W4I7]MDQ0691519.1 hypothetical protein [Arthrobacter sp. W4I7]
MLKTLLCKINVGHHWVAAADPDGNFNRHCVNCGKVDAHVARWPDRLSARDHPPHDALPDIPTSDY